MAKIIKLTKAELKQLQAFDISFRSAREGYLRSIGRQGNALLRQFYEKIIGKPYEGSDACGHCELTLLQIVAPSYFAALEAETKAATKKAEKK